MLCQFLHIRYFTEAVFDIHNCINVTVSDCYFLNNSGTGIILEPFRGNSGALAITYNYMDTSLNGPIIIVSDCTFVNNSAAATMNRRTTNQIFATGVLTGRGGAMALFVNETNLDISARVINCSFTGNYASEFAGGLYVYFAGLGSHNVSVEDCHFYSNRATLGAGGVIFVGTRGNILDPHVYYATRCHFEYNSAAVGGGLYFSIDLSEGRSNMAHLSRCTFIHNMISNERDGYGAAFTVVNAENYSDKELFPINTITDW